MVPRWSGAGPGLGFAPRWISQYLYHWKFLSGVDPQVPNGNRGLKNVTDIQIIIWHQFISSCPPASFKSRLHLGRISSLALSFSKLFWLLSGHCVSCSLWIVLAHLNNTARNPITVPCWQIIRFCRHSKIKKTGPSRTHSEEVIWGFAAARIKQDQRGECRLQKPVTDCRAWDASGPNCSQQSEEPVDVPGWGQVYAGTHSTRGCLEAFQDPVAARCS